MRRLWCDPVSNTGRFYTPPATASISSQCNSRTRRFTSGRGDAALQRVASLGQGWFGFNTEPAAVAERVLRLTALLAERGRSRTDVTISISPYMLPCDFDTVQRYRDAGVDQVIVMPMAFDPDSLRATLDHLAETIVEPARRL
jgi:alkanesulfonate monooxygenase SsuD/methylene tetrahydromethanopterin reductase-like flavin-dependent oxidoreductase (luciferase family)